MSPRLILPPERCGPDHPEWHEARRIGITATDVPVIMGQVPGDWGSPFNLYWVKRGEIDPPPENDVMRLGRDLEPSVIQRFAERHPELTLMPGGLYAHAEREWQLATPDRPAYDTPAYEYRRHYRLPDDAEPVTAVEAKSVSSWDDWGGEGTGDMPMRYKIQGLWQADVLGLPEVRFAVLNRVNGEFREYVVTYDPGEAAVLRKEAGAFLDRVRFGDPPPVDSASTTTAALKALHPDLDEGIEVAVGKQLASRYRSAVRRRKHAEERETYYKNRVLAALGTAQYAVCGGEKIATRSVSNPTRFDRKRLKAELPDVYAEYSYTAVEPTVTLTPAKEPK